MKIILFCLVLLNSIFANEFYAKLEPVQSYKVKASTSGKIIYTNEEIEGSQAKNSLIIEIDSKLNTMDLKQSRNKMNYLNQMIKIEANNYTRLKKVSSKSIFEKDNQRLKVITLRSQKADMEIKIESLKDTISNKKLIEKSNYIFNISVKKGDYVNAGTLLYEAKDISKGKLEIFIPISSVEDIKTKTIYLDGKETDLKINKIYSIADDVHISAYKAQIIVEDTKMFSRLIKIEFK